jgi:hypothetical protein
MSTDTPAPLGHNKPPVVIPVEGDMLEDLQVRYPEIDKRIAEWDKAFTEYPDDIPLEQEDVAQNLQDLLGQVSKESKTWTDSFMKAEKKPLNAILKVVGNFFTGRFEKAEKLLEKWKPVHQAFLDKKKDAAIKAAQAEAERLREAERVATKAAEAAKLAQAESERKAEEKRKEEEAARLAAQKAEDERIASVARAEAAKIEERRQADERKARDRAEKDAIAVNMREIREFMREAEKLNTAADSEEISDDDAARLDVLIRAGGTIGELARPVASSMLLDDEQKERINVVRARLGELRDAQNARFGKREQKRRAAEAKAEQERLDREAETRRLQREEDDRAAAAARKVREDEEAAAAKAKADRKAAEDAGRAAKDAAREHEGDAKGAGREVRQAGADADRSASRADRLETKLGNSTEADLSRTRGDLGTVGSLSRNWKHAIVDEDALRAALHSSITVAEYAILADQLNSEALNGAVYRFMRLHQDGWRGRERVADVLAGVVFSYETEARIA